MFPGFFLEADGSATEVGDFGETRKEGEVGEVGESGWLIGALVNDVGLVGIGTLGDFGVEFVTCSSLLAIDADTSTTV